MPAPTLTVRVVRTDVGLGVHRCAARTYRRALVATSLDDRPRELVTAAIASLDSEAGSIVLLHAYRMPSACGRMLWRPLRLERELADCAKESLVVLARSIAPPAPHFDTVVRSGDAFPIILREMAANGCDVVVVGRRRPGWWRRDAIVERLVESAACDVVMVGSPTRDATSTWGRP